MNITNFKKNEIANNPHGVEVKVVYNTDNALINHLFLKAGESLKAHITPVDVAFYVLEGNPTIMVGDEKIVVKKDDLIESPKNIIHCIYNETESDVRVLVMKLPKPITKSIFPGK